MFGRMILVIFLGTLCLPDLGQAARTHATTQVTLTAEASHDPAVVARLFSLDQATVNEAYRLDLTERATWVVLRLSKACGCAPAQLMRERRTRSWGEVARLHGFAWAALMDELDQVIGSVGWTWTAPSLEQIRRSSANDPDSLKRPEKQ